MAKILIVDDSADLRFLLNSILKQNKFETSCASCKKEMVACLASADLILLDIQLGDEDGREICKELKHTGELTVPVILISARGDLLKTYLAYNANDCMKKPFDVPQLVNKINDMLNLPHHLYG